MKSDSELLRQFARTNSQDAFAELVKRHVDLVYSAALRQTGCDAHLAQDVAQSVFTDLAHKALTLSRRESLAGWLYTSAHFAAAKITRTENRRRNREENFMRDTSAEPAPQADWEKIRPMLDEAMHKLNETDREAVLLRYFENKPFAEVGERLGLNENAARMRVERALEKLRGIFAKSGVTIAGALATVISANAIQLAPANLAVTLTTASLAAAETGTTFTLLKIMTATKLKLGLAAMVVAGAATAIVVQHQTLNQLRNDNTSLRQQIAQLQADNQSLSNQLVDAGEAKSLSDEQFDELLKLRVEVTQLRQQRNDPSSTVQSTTNNLQHTERTSIRVQTKLILLPPEDLQALGVEWKSGAQDSKAGLLTEKQFEIINEALQGASDVKIIGAPSVISLNGMESRIGVSKPVPAGGTNTNVGISLYVLPYFSTNSSTFDVTFSAELRQLIGDPLQPTVQTMQITNQMSLLPGQTAVLEKEIPGSGWLTDATNIPDGPRVLVLFVTPTIVDSRNYQRNGQRVGAIWESTTNIDSSDFPASIHQQYPPSNQ